MTPKELRAIRERMGLTQAEFAERLKITRNTVARMERSLQAITPPMALLIGYVAREAGVDATNPTRGRKLAEGKRAHAKAAKASAGKVRKTVPV